jgi:head-tail adaptor
MRFLYVDPKTGTTRRFNIEFVRDVDERNRVMECACHEATT